MVLCGGTHERAGRDAARGSRRWWCGMCGVSRGARSLWSLAGGVLVLRTVLPTYTAIGAPRMHSLGGETELAARVRRGARVERAERRRRERRQRAAETSSWTPRVLTHMLLARLPSRDLVGHVVALAFMCRCVADSVQMLASSRAFLRAIHVSRSPRGMSDMPGICADVR